MVNREVATETEKRSFEVTEEKVSVSTPTRDLLITFWMSKYPQATDDDRFFLERSLRLPQKESNLKKWIREALGPDRNTNAA